MGAGVVVGAGSGAGQHGVSLLRTTVQCAGSDGTQGAAANAVAGRDTGTGNADAHADELSPA